MSSQQWSWDEVPSYRLNKDIIDGYLREIFGNYRTFRTEVNAGNSSQSNNVLIGPCSSSMILTDSTSQKNLQE